MIYVSADGKYLLHGDLIDLGKHQNLGDAAWSRSGMPSKASWLIPHPR